MAAFMDKVQVNTAITDNTYLDLSCQHITTSNFLQWQPVYIRQMVPGEKLTVDAEAFTRMNPLVVPTFGRANLKLSGYVVPARTIFPGFNDFITDAPHTAADYDAKNTNVTDLLQTVPLVSNTALIGAFTSYQGTTIDDRDMMVFAGTTTDYDFRLYNAQQQGYTYWKYTIMGMQAKKILESLGYRINPNTADATNYSSMNLLAAARIYLDWYFPQQYTNTQDYETLLGLCRYDVGSHGQNLSPVLSLTSADVYTILKTVAFAQYNSDYLTSCWDAPNQPSVGTYSDFKLVNIDRVASLITGNNAQINNVQGGYVTNNSGSGDNDMRVVGANAPFITPLTSYGVQGTYSISTPVSEYLLHSLHALTDYMKRHQLSGSAAFSRFLSRYGKALSPEKLNRSIYLGTNNTPLQIGDVMSHSDTTGAALGDYAGRGLAYLQPSSFEYTSDEFAYFVIVATIIPAVGYFQGINPSVKRITKLEHFVPEFDNLSVAPVTKDEVYMSDGATLSGTSLIDPAIHDEIFGYLPTSWSYKVGFDNVTGNFRIPTLNGALGSGTPVNFNAANSWYLMRAFSDSTWNDSNGVPDRTNIVHSPSFILGREDAGQYNRIFYNASESAPDQFTVIYNFEAHAYAPMKSLFDVYEFEDKGKKVTMDVSGVKKN